MKHLKIFNTQTDYNNVKETLPLPNMCLLNDIYEIASEGDDDIVPIEYLESTGTQYIDSGFVPNNESGIYLRAYSQSNSGNHFAVGVRENSGDSRWAINYYSSNSIEIDWNTWLSYSIPHQNVWTEVENNFLNTKTGEINNIIKRMDYPQLSSITKSTYIFALNYPDSYKFIGRISNVKISQGNNIVMNFIPVRIGSIGYMLDNVSKKLFANAGTGSFTLGSDIVSVEYLKGASGTIINTGIIGTDNLKIEVKYDISAHEQYGAVLGNYIDENTNCFRIILQSSSNNHCFINVNTRAGSSGQLTNGGIKNTPMVVVMSKTSIKLNGTSITPPTTNGNANLTNIALFSKNISTSPPGTMGVKIYYCKMWNNNILIRDFIPVRIGTVGYMYDKVSRKLFANAGTGSFVVGPDNPKIKLTRSK